jgi:hypothetical protein
LGRSTVPIAAVLVIFGSFFLRWGVIMASERL